MNNQNDGAVQAFKDKPKGPSEDAYTTMLKFLEEIKIVFDIAICGTPTGDVRNGLTELNIRRMEFISEGNAAALHSIRLHTILDKLVISEAALAKMSSDDNRFGRARYQRGKLLEELIKLMQE